MKWLQSFLLVTCFVFIQKSNSQDIPSNRIIETNKLVNYLNPDVQKSFKGVKNISEKVFAKNFLCGNCPRWYSKQTPYFIRASGENGLGQGAEKN